MKFYAAFHNFQGNAVIMPPGKYAVERFSWNALGGPEEATITVTGTLPDLMNLFLQIRTPVEICDQAGRALWWGYVSDVKVQAGVVNVGATMKNMANKVRVSYNIGGQLNYTDWAVDDDSRAAYGTLELTEALNDAAADAAIARRDALLETRKYPLSSPITQMGAAGSELKATLTCSGWWSTFDWTYYAREKVDVIYENTSKRWSDQPMYGTEQYNLIYQPIPIPGSDEFDIDSIELITYAQPDTSAYVKLAWYQNRQDLANNVAPLSSVDTRLTGFYNWGSYFPRPRLHVHGGEVYWLAIMRGTLPPGTVPVWGEGWSVGGEYCTEADAWAAFVYSTEFITYWITVDPPQRFTYRLRGVKEHGVLMSEIAAASEFIKVFTIDTSTGQYSATYQDGKTRAGQVLQRLIEAGRNDHRPLLGMVTRERSLFVYAAPESDNPGVFMDLKGNLFDPSGSPTLECPVGKWCSLRGLPYPIGSMPDPTLFFVERAEFNVEDGQWNVEPRDSASPWSVGEIT